MTRSPLFNFILGTAMGALMGAAATLHVVTKQIQAHTAGVAKSIEDSQQNYASSMGTAQKVITAWQQRAEKCEVRDRNATALYEYRREELPGLAILHGAFSINLGSRENRPGSMKLVWVIPAQVPVYTNIPGAQFEWIDGKTGASIGRFPAVPPPDAAVPQ
jgi:hypothetical protein